MAKAKLKEKVEGVTEDPVKGNIPEGIQIIDLSPEKRAELYQLALKKFDEEGVKIYGMSVSVELKFTPGGIVPQMKLVDMLKKPNVQAPKTNKPEAPKV